MIEGNLVVTGYGGRAGEAGGKDYKTQEETLGGYRYIHYLDCGDSFTGRLLSKLVKLHTLKICTLCENYTLTKLLKTHFADEESQLLGIPVAQRKPGCFGCKMSATLLLKHPKQVK